MKLSFNREDLLESIQTVQSSVSAKSTLPILSNLLLKVTEKAGPQTVLMEATDLEIGVRTTVRAEVIEEGKVTVPAKRALDLIKEMPEGKEIEFSSTDGKKVFLKCGKVKASLMALSPEDFPIIPEFQKTGSFRIKKSDFREMIKKTHFAASADETRRVLNGVYFSAGDGQIRMVSTDGRRLACISKNIPDKSLSAGVIIPSKTVSELSRLLALSENAEEDWVEIAPASNQIGFQWRSRASDIAMISRVVDGTYPNYDQVIPKSKEIEWSVDGEKILAAVRRASLFAQDRGGSIRFGLQNGLLKISANTQGIGEEDEELEIDYKGPDFEIAFNPSFLLDVLRNCDCKQIRFEFTTSLNPGVIKPQGESQDYICVIMPMRLQ